MSFRFITSVLVVASTITAFAAAPVRADSDDVARILGTAATLFIIGKIIEDANDGRATVTTRSYSAPKHHVYRDRKAYTHGRDTRSRRALLPRTCLRDSHGRSTRYIVSARCLQSHYRGARGMPSQCRANYKSRHGLRSGYSLRCLRSRGYQVAGH